MRWLSKIAVFLVLVALIASQPSLAEMWCGNGPRTELSHPCAEADQNYDVAAAIEKVRDGWVQLKGIYFIDDDNPYHNRPVNIVVHVDSDASPSSIRGQLPAEVDGIPVVVVSGQPPLFSGVGFKGMLDSAGAARREREQEGRQRAKEQYDS